MNDASTFHRHCNQSERTLDGNHHANQMIKNNDPNDVSLSYGHSYFPERTAFDEYLKCGEALKGHHAEVSSEFLYLSTKALY